jgi:predicted membrane-bound spermidine synthase
MASKISFLIFLMAVLFFLSLSIILFELALTRIFSIVLWYDYAFMAISIAFFGLGIGAFVIHIQRVKIKSQKKKSTTEPQFDFASRIVQFAIAYAISVPAFIFLIGYIPSDTSYIYVFYLVSSIPFFFAGACMAIIFLAMSEGISKLYFADLIGAASATIILDPVMQTLGAGSVLLLTSVAVVGASACSYYFVFLRDTRDRKGENLLYHDQPGGAIKREKVKTKPRNRLNLFAVITFAGLAMLLIVNSISNIGIFEIKPGVSKGLYYQITHPSEFEHLSEEWNSFSRVDVSHKLIRQEDNNNILEASNNNNAVTTTATTTDTDTDSRRELASIIIDADAATPIFRWNGSRSDLAWIQKYMDYLPYKMINTNNTLVIGSGGGEDILVALSGGADNITAVELNPLVVSAVKSFGNQSGNIYDDNNSNNINLFIDDGRRFISSTTEKFDVIVLKLVDSWAAQLAGGYALSENYLYTVEAFQQYLHHLDKKDGGMLVMTRWNFELPRLMPLLVDSLVKETGESRESVVKHIMVVEDRPGLYFGRSDDNQKYYPVLVMVKSTPFDDRQISLVNEEAQRNHAEITLLADSYVAAPFSKLFNNDNAAYKEYFSTTAAANPTIPTDNSPFYFAREQVPKQMIILLATVVAISGLLSVLLIYHARKTRIQFDSRSRFHILFAIFIGLGFMILEVTFIQKFLLLLGTPIMALTVILFSILLSSGIGSYLSGKIFSTRRSHRAVLTSIPILAGIIILYFLYLQEIMASTISMELTYRIALTFGLLFPAGFLMGFQFPSLIRMGSLSSTSSASSIALKGRNEEMVYSEENNNNKNNNTTLLWGINIIASIIGTVVAVIVAMIIGFNGNLLIGLCMYSGAGACALFSLYYMRNNRTRPFSIGGNF